MIHELDRFDHHDATILAELQSIIQRESKETREMLCELVAVDGFTAITTFDVFAAIIRGCELGS